MRRPWSYMRCPEFFSVYIWFWTLILILPFSLLDFYSLSRFMSVTVCLCFVFFFLQYLRLLLLHLVCFSRTVFTFYFMPFTNLYMWFFMLIFVSSYKGRHTLCYFSAPYLNALLSLYILLFSFNLFILKCMHIRTNMRPI